MRQQHRVKNTFSNDLSQYSQLKVLILAADKGEKHTMGNTLKEAIAKKEGEAKLVTGDTSDNGNLQGKSAEDGSGDASGKQEEDKDRYLYI